MARGKRSTEWARLVKRMRKGLNSLKRDTPEMKSISGCGEEIACVVTAGG